MVLLIERIDPVLKPTTFKPAQDLRDTKRIEGKLGMSGPGNNDEEYSAESSPRPDRTEWGMSKGLYTWRRGV
jgi:hypothetical protein